jgi:hypothetical protein
MKRQIKGRPSAHTHTQRERWRPSDINLVHTYRRNKPNRPRPLSCRKSNVCREREKKKGGQGRRPPSLRRFCCVSFFLFNFFLFSFVWSGSTIATATIATTTITTMTLMSHGALAAHILFISLFVFCRPFRQKVPGRFFREKKMRER